MKNFIESGKALTVTMNEDVDSGDVVIIGDLVGVAAGTYLDGEQGVINRDGVYKLAKNSSVFAVGDPVYGTVSGAVVTSVATDNTLIGVAVTAELTGAATVNVLVR